MTIRNYDHAEEIYDKMEDAVTRIRGLMEALEGTELEGWNEALTVLLEDVKQGRDEAEVVLDQDREQVRAEEDYSWYHR